MTFQWLKLNLTVSRLLPLMIFFPFAVFSFTLDKHEAERFARHLFWQRDSLPFWFDSASLRSAHRLGIEYEAVDYKNLIAYDVEDTIKALVKNRQINYAVTVDSLDKEYSIVTISYDLASLQNRYYFRGNRCVSPLVYLTRNWKVVESKYFRFFLSDSSLTNAYCMERLDLFVKQMAALLALPDIDIARLQKNKIYYYLCRNEDEIENLTGFRARGMYNLAYDALVTTYPDHLHELTHLLINFKLHRLPLYTHPLLQEGFAVAYGGRGGLESGVLLSLGSFLYRSQTVELSTLLNKPDFDQLDPSITYPAAGLYNKFLVEAMGMKSYLNLYRTHSGASDAHSVLQIAPDELVGDTVWQRYIRKSADNQVIMLDSGVGDSRVIFDDKLSRVSEDGAWYHFLLSDSLLVPSMTPFPDFRSVKFSELFPGKEYHGEMYLIRTSREEITVYNLLTDNLIASYAQSFSIPPMEVPRSGGKFSFSVKKEVFDEPIEQLLRKHKQIIEN